MLGNSGRFGTSIACITVDHRKCTKEYVHVAKEIPSSAQKMLIGFFSCIGYSKRDMTLPERSIDVLDRI